MSNSREDNIVPEINLENGVAKLFVVEDRSGYNVTGGFASESQAKFVALQLGTGHHVMAYFYEFNCSEWVYGE